MKTARFVVGELVTGSLVTCPPAHADFDVECKAGCWGAAELWCDVKESIAVSADGKAFTGSNALFQDAADAAALNTAPPGSTIDLRDCNG